MKIPISKAWSNITFLKSHYDLPEANELRGSSSLATMMWLLDINHIMIFELSKCLCLKCSDEYLTKANDFQHSKLLAQNNNTYYSRHFRRVYFDHGRQFVKRFNSIPGHSPILRSKSELRSDCHGTTETRVMAVWWPSGLYSLCGPGSHGTSVARRVGIAVHYGIMHHITNSEWIDILIKFWFRYGV